MNEKKFIDKEAVKNIDVSEIGKIGKPDTIYKVFPNEETARCFLSYIRWGEFASCPYCHNDKVYFIEKGRRFKCANPQCHKKFSVTVKTLMENTNLTVDKWVYCLYNYYKKRGRIFTYDIKILIGSNIRTAYYIKKKMDFAWKFVDRTNKTERELFESFVKEMIWRYEHQKDLFKIKNDSSYWRIDYLDDMSKPEQYDKMLNYTAVRLKITEYIRPGFCSPQDVLANLYLFMQENKIKEYDAKFIEILIIRMISRLWWEFIKADPNLAARHRDRDKEWRKLGRINLKNWYIGELMRGSKKYKLYPALRFLPEEREKHKQKLINTRKKLYRMIDWQSHFD